MPYSALLCRILIQASLLCFLQILPGIQNEDAEVRNMAMQALGLCCYLSKDLLVSYIPLFMQVS